VRVVIAEDNYLLREGLQQVLELADDVDVVAAVGDADELLAAVARDRPDVVVTDIRMPPTHTDEGVRAALAIRRAHPATGVVVLSQYASPAYALELVSETSTGLGYLLKDRVSDIEQLVAAMRAVASGGSVVDSEVVRALMDARAVSAASPLADLTDREREVLAAMAQGLSNSAISATTHAAERTVEKYISSIFAKLHLADEPDVNRRVQAVLVYLSADSGAPAGDDGSDGDGSSAGAGSPG
jgi:DNA-binding NarL/FixJ family response regulator